MKILKKNILLLMFSGAFLSLFSQDKIYFGVESGLSLGYINMGIPKTNVEGFQNITTFALAPTGFSLSKELKNKWMLESGFFKHTVVNQGYGFLEEYAPGKLALKRRYSSTDATTFTFKILRFYHRERKVIFSPHIGFTYCGINQLNSIKEDFKTTNSGVSISNGIEVRDTLKSSILYTTNNFLAIDFGLRTWFKLSSRTYLTFDVNYFMNPGSAISFEILNYKKDGKPLREGYSVHKARSLFVQLGFRWHWKDLHSVM